MQKENPEGTRLRRLLAALSVPVVGLATASGWVDADVTDVIIVEPGDALDGVKGALVLALGIRGEAAAVTVEAAGRAGATAIAVKVDSDGVPEALRTAARAADIAVLGVPVSVRWEHLEAQARAVLDSDRRTGPTPPEHGDLFSLAQTIATLTGGAVSIEDSTAHVLAYSRCGEEADELRRLTILGRNCPEPYLALLRQWGVHHRLRAGDQIVEIDEQPELGYHRRLAIGITAGSRALGAIWVQQGTAPLAERTGEVLLGAARLAARQLVDHYYRGDSSARVASRFDLASGLLTGRFNSAALAVDLGLDPSGATSLVAVDLREPTAAEPTWLDLRRAEAAEIIAVHAAAYRRNALVAQACGQIYAILPDTPSGADEEALKRWAGDLVSVLRQYTGTPVQAAVAGTAQHLDDIPAVKLRGYHALQILARTPQRATVTHREVKASLLLHDLLELMEQHQEIRDPDLDALLDHDRVNGTDLARSLLHYLDAFGDVGRMAAQLNVHPNTLRYRVRKAVALTGLDLDDPDQRLFAMLQLRLSTARNRIAGDPFPTT